MPKSGVIDLHRDRREVFVRKHSGIVFFSLLQYIYIKYILFSWAISHCPSPKSTAIDSIANNTAGPYGHSKEKYGTSVILASHHPPSLSVAFVCSLFSHTHPNSHCSHTNPHLFYFILLPNSIDTLLRGKVWYAIW